MKIDPDLFLRLAVAFAFLYPPVSAYLNPTAWLWFVPDFVELVVSKQVFLNVFGVMEIALALAIIFMKNPTYPLFAASAILAGILVLDYTAFDVVFRDVSILLAAVALILLHRERRTNTISSTNSN